MNDRSCGCCEGTEPLTPLPTANRPGLEALRYRVGTHATFLETMLARLSSHYLPDGRRPLQRLTTRTGDDPSIALLDAWATVADVLTFYQERIANEGYLPTATERRSVLELARLVGYRPRPGVAASVYLAFTLEQDYEIEVPARTRAQSIPEPGDLPQAFETEEALPARTRWNAIPARRTRPHFLQPDPAFAGMRALRLEGAVSDLKVSGLILFVCQPIQGAGAAPFAVPYTIREVSADPESDTTRVEYVPFRAGVAAADDTGGAGEGSPGDLASLTMSGHADDHGIQPSLAAAPPPALARLGTVVQALGREPSLPPPSRFELARPLEQTYTGTSDIGPRLLAALTPRLADALYAAYAKAPVTAAGPCHVEALRVKAAPFGHNAPPRLIVRPEQPPTPGPDWDLRELADLNIDSARVPVSGSTSPPFRTISLDQVYDEITPGGWIVIHRRDPPDDLPDPVVTRVEEVRTVTRADYGMSAKVTQVVLADPWLSETDHNRDIGLLRGTTVFALSDPLELAEEEIEEYVAGDTIELDGLYDGLEAGRWLVVRGERTDVPGLGQDEGGQGVEASELVMLAGVVHDVHRVGVGTGLEGEDAGSAGDDGELPMAVDEPDTPTSTELPGDTLHTRLVLSEPLAYTYRRGTVRINANVVRATHGETREEVLGAGDGARAFQSFTLKQRPLTYVSAPTPNGVESTLEVRVNGVRWPERETLLHLGPADRGHVTTTDDAGNVAVVFGDGTRGARLPTGIENVSAVYRSGIGKGGNVGAEQISVLASRPLGVKGVVNPQRASGGADPESRDQARWNAPLAVLALDRLVAVQDYADFARTFAGVGKAAAATLSDGRRQMVHLTIAGADDVPVDPGSDLRHNLMRALRRFGDRNTPLRVDVREAAFLLMSARVKVHEDHLWSVVEPKLRSVLLEAFGFERRELGESLALSEVIGAMHGVEGVEYVAIDLFDTVSESEAAEPATLAEKLEELAAVAASHGSPATSGAASAPGEGSPIQPRRHIHVHPARVLSAAPGPGAAQSGAAGAAGRIRPARIAYLNPGLPDTLILTEITT